MSGLRKTIVYGSIGILSLCLICIAALVALVPFCNWVETHERHYEDVTAMSKRGYRPEFMPASAKQIHSVTQSDNNQAWMKFLCEDYQSSLDSTLFEPVLPDSDNVKIISSPPLIWWSEDWRERLRDFHHDTKKLRIKSPPFTAWWPEDLNQDEFDVSKLAKKYKFFRSIKPYKLSGFAAKPILVHYTIIIMDEDNNTVYVWTEF